MIGRRRPDAWAMARFSLRSAGPCSCTVATGFHGQLVGNPCLKCVQRVIFIFPRKNAPESKICQIFKSSAGEGSDSGRLMLLVSIAAARSHIRIAKRVLHSVYLTMPTLLTALRRGVKIEIITPGTDIDAHIVRAVGKARWKPLLEPVPGFTQYQPARFHCKYLLVDDCWASSSAPQISTTVQCRCNEEAN